MITLNASAAMTRLHLVALREHSLHALLHNVANLMTQVIPGSVEASVCVLVADRPYTLVYTGQLAVDLGEIQCREGFGPSLHAARTGQVAEIVDARADSRWPGYMQLAVQRGCLSSLSIGLGSNDGLTAEATMYSREAAAFARDCQRTVKNLARFTARALARMHAEQTADEFADNLQAAFETRAVSDRGHGILGERHAVSSEQSFRTPTSAAPTSGRNLKTSPTT